MKFQTHSITAFQKLVYDFVRKIPTGHTVTYKQVASGIGKPKAYRAVGNALNKNPFAPEVPCHRVIKSDGSIGGFYNPPPKNSGPFIHQNSHISKTTQY